MRDQLNQMCRTQEQVSGSQQYLDTLEDALESLQTSQSNSARDLGISQSFKDVNPKIGIYATANALVNSIQVAGKYQFDIGVTGMIVNSRLDPMSI